jgi:hypothetical protein
MVALHNIEPSKCDVKTVIKATSLCFNEAEVYTAEVLAVVINQLLEQTPLPTLLMRTVIQTLALHSKLSGFIMNTLGRLVKKQVMEGLKKLIIFVKKTAAVHLFYFCFEDLDSAESMGRFRQVLSTDDTKEYTHFTDSSSPAAKTSFGRSSRSSKSFGWTSYVFLPTAGMRIYGF